MPLLPLAMILSAAHAFPSSPCCNRRAAVLSAVPSLLLATSSRASTPTDPYSHWAYGRVPPPVERTVSYDEMVDMIRSGGVQSLQIAVQHDCVEATTREGHRVTLLLPDKEFDSLYAEVMDAGFQVQILPMDETKQAVRRAGQAALAAYLVCATWAWLLHKGDAHSPP